MIVADLCCWSDQDPPRSWAGGPGGFIAASPGRDVLDVGCGTGTAARQFLAAGCSVLGVEPDGRMAEFAWRTGVAAEVATFEDWDPVGRGFDAVVAGTAWHWVDPVAGAAKAARVLRPGGRLAPFNHVFQPPPEVAGALVTAFRQVVPVSPAQFTDQLTRPAVEVYQPLFDRIADGIRQAGRFSDPEQWRYGWERAYSRDEWLEQLPTHGILTRLDPGQLAAFSARVDLWGLCGAAGWLRVAGGAACWRVRQDAQFGPPAAGKLLGALPVVAGFCSRLKIRDVIDEACPVGDLAELTHGQVIEALVANRLTAPSPLVHVQSWARDWAVGEALGAEPGLLNDDRIGRALDAIAPRLDQIAGSVGVTAIEAFGIDVTQMHWDMTSISVHGEYEQVQEGFPAPKFGHPKDRRLDLKQVQTGIAVSGDGSVPVFHRAFDGGAGEVGQVIPVMKALQEMAAKRRLLIVGDSKLISYANLAAMDSGGVSFVAPASRTYVPAAEPTPPGS